MQPKPVVLVTGTSTGIGREAVTHLREAGALVIATARNPHDIKDLAKPGKVEVARLDVADAALRQEAIAWTLERHGRIDALVNNAGYGAMLSQEDTRVEDMQRMFDVNVFGLHDLTRRVLPSMREQGHGRIVNVASIAGHVSVPMMGTYCASKFAVRAMTSALHTEVKGFGIHACLIEPGVIRTKFGKRSLKEVQTVVPDYEGNAYRAAYERWEKDRMTSKGAHPKVIARQIVHASLSKHPKFHYFAPLHAKAANVAKRLLPDALLHAGMRRYFQR